MDIGQSAMQGRLTVQVSNGHRAVSNGHRAVSNAGYAYSAG